MRSSKVVATPQSPAGRPRPLAEVFWAWLNPKLRDRNPPPSRTARLAFGVSIGVFPMLISQYIYAPLHLPVLIKALFSGVLGGVTGTLFVTHWRLRHLEKQMQGILDRLDQQPATLSVQPGEVAEKQAG